MSVFIVFFKCIDLLSAVSATAFCLSEFGRKSFDVYFCLRPPLSGGHWGGSRTSLLHTGTFNHRLGRGAERT